MTNQNDARILKLKEQIELKKEKLKKIKGFRPITNCILDLEGVKFNLNALTKGQNIHLLIRLNALFSSAKELGLEGEYMVSGYKLGDWIEDLKAKLEVLSRVDEEKKLKAMESKLTELLSVDKKVELELDEMEDWLK